MARLAWACALAAATLSLAVAATRAAASPADQSVAYQMTPSHDGQMADAGLSAPLAQAWSITLPATSSWPLIVNGTVFVSTNDHQLHALNQATGATLWSRDIGPGTFPWSALAYDRGQVFTATLEGQLTAFDASTGDTNWSRRLPSSEFVSSPPTAAHGILYVPADDTGLLYALDETDGHVHWSRAAQSGQSSSPAVGADAVYVGFSCQRNYAFTAVTGNALWHTTPSCVGGGGDTAVLAGGRLFTRGPFPDDDQILSAATGDVLGSYATDPPPAVAGSVAFVLSDSTLRAIAGLGLGATAWEFAGDGELTSAPIVVGDLVFVGSSSGQLYALDRATGNPSWSQDVGGVGALGAANGTVVVTSGSTVSAYRTAAAIDSAPVNRSAPTIDGKPQAGAPLAADVGIWSGLPSSYAYHWQRCDAAGGACGDVAGATGASLAATATDIGHTFRVRVVASNAIAASPALTSSATAVVVKAAPVDEAPPTIGAVAREDETLTADPGTWSGEPTSYAYQWRRCPQTFEPCTDIAGATGSTYVVRTANISDELEVRVVASNEAGDSDPATSAPTAAVVAAPPVNLVAPDVGGFLNVGAPLVADRGTWSKSPTDYAYQWYSCADDDSDDCPDIAGATGSSYTVHAEDLGRDIGVAVVASNAAGASEPAYSGAFGPVLPTFPIARTQPVISGTADEGQTLTASSGTWYENPTSYAYQWYRCDDRQSCADIAGATSPAYVVQDSDVGTRLIVTVVATNAGGDSLEAESQPTALVPLSAPVNQRRPAIVGAAAEGVRLVADPGAWSHRPASYTFVWQRCNAAGATCKAIPGATAANQQLLAADVGSRLVVLVTAANVTGRSSAVASEPSAPVAPAPSSSFDRLSVRVRAGGAIALTVRARNPGAFSASATASSRLLAAKRCVRRCPKARQVAYGRGAAKLAAPGKVVLVVKPNSRARRAIAGHRRIVVRIGVTFRSTLGGASKRRISSVTVQLPRARTAR